MDIADLISDGRVDALGAIEAEAAGDLEGEARDLEVEAAGGIEVEATGERTSQGL